MRTLQSTDQKFIRRCFVFHLPAYMRKCTEMNKLSYLWFPEMPPFIVHARSAHLSQTSGNKSTEPHSFANKPWTIHLPLLRFVLHFCASINAINEICDERDDEYHNLKKLIFHSNHSIDWIQIHDGNKFKIAYNAFLYTFDVFVAMENKWSILEMREDSFRDNCTHAHTKKMICSILICFIIWILREPMWCEVMWYARSMFVRIIFMVDVLDCHHQNENGKVIGLRLIEESLLRIDFVAKKNNVRNNKQTRS